MAINKKFKIIFPSGYNVEDIYNDNIDIFVVYSDTTVYVATLFTVKNIEYYMNKNGENHFWSSDTFIVKNLKRLTIIRALEEVIENDAFNDIFRYIGKTKDVLDEENLLD